MKHRSPAGLAGLVLAAALAAPAYAGPTVAVRVEGTAGTLLERARVTLPDTPPPVASCGAHTAAAAIEVATAGNWDRRMLVETILGETHAFAASDYWAEWLDRGSGIKRGAGICTDVLKEGDELVMLADVSPPPNYAPSVFPLDLEGVPGQARAGEAVTVTVVEYRSKTGAIGEGDRTPVAGATVRAGAATATSGPDGQATLVLGERGAVAVKATRQGNAASGAELVTVGDVSAAPSAPDTTAPAARILGIRDRQVFTRRRAPRELRGTVAADPSGLWAVKIRLSRRFRGDCWYFSGSREQFLKRTCGKKHAFKVGEEGEWSYLLPARLPRGRYWLDLYGIDRAFRKTAFVRGTNRVTFRVR